MALGFGSSDEYGEKRERLDVEHMPDSQLLAIAKDGMVVAMNESRDGLDMLDPKKTTWRSFGYGRCLARIAHAGEYLARAKLAAAELLRREEAKGR